jgi:DNA-directed RNA polymerase specialized sigma24 family protein
LARPAEGTPAPKAQSIDECAYILGIPAATVKTGMFYARKKLAELVAWGAGLPE